MKKLALFLCAVFSFVVINVFLDSEVSAAKISDKDISKKATFLFSSGKYSQGATLTKDSYVFTEWIKNGTSGTFVIRKCSRTKKKAGQHPCKYSKSFSGKPSSMYHKWGTDYAQAILRKSKDMVCIQLSTMKKVDDSKCGGMMSSDKLSVGDDCENDCQGWTKYGNYYLRGYGTSGGTIYLLDKNKKEIGDWSIPLSGGEIEDVMVDGDTGQVWFTFIRSRGNVEYYAVAKSVFDKWIKPGADGGSSGGSSRSSKAPSKSPSTKTYTFTPAKSQYDGTVETTFFGKLKDPDGCGVYTTLNFVLDILFVGVGIAAVVGISFAGVKYLTARDNIDQTKRARKWIFQILIGVAIYAVIYGLASWLLADTNFSGDSCKEVTKNLDAGERNDISAKMP